MISDMTALIPPGRPEKKKKKEQYIINMYYLFINILSNGNLLIASDMEM